MTEYGVSDFDAKLAADVAAYQSLEPDAALAARIRARAQQRLYQPLAPVWRARVGLALGLCLVALLVVVLEPQLNPQAPQSVQLPVRQAVAVSLPAVPSTIRVETGRLRAPATIPSPTRPTSSSELDDGIRPDTTTHRHQETFDAHS